ncbi:MAG: meso-butanediol dehydrogenase/(S,S)-butanediol dehydrogenase/diacetyl reductase [Halieaceae bacterium]|jgi:meso-butanediol dehydrogenase/(S,S)-butanediol dehydrogenase/diacetyl reductase
MGRRFEGKVAIVTGGSLGIGRSCVLQLAREGATVVACARRKPKLDELGDAVAALGGKFKGVGLDVNDIEGFAALINATAEQFGRLDVLINNAPSVKGGLVLDQTIEDWRSNFTASVDSVFVGCREAMRIMQRQGSGSIVNVSSVSSLRAGIAAAAYSASKAAVNQFTACAAMEAAPYNVRLNVVAPGSTMTPGMEAATRKDRSIQDGIAGSIPMNRHGSSEEMAEAICFLASDQASFITGVVLPVDGGKTPQMYIPDFDITALNNVATP